jgi:hypothetical protein
MLVGDLQSKPPLSTKGCLSWKMVWWVKGLMNHPILMAQPMWDILYTHTRGRGSIKVEQNSQDVNIPLILGNVVRKGQSFTKGTEVRGSTPQSQHRNEMLLGEREKTSTKKPKGCLHWKKVWWLNGLMNHPILKAVTNVGLLRTHTRGRGRIKVERNSFNRICHYY